MRVLCWNVNESVWDHWNKVCPTGAALVRSQSFEQTIESIESNEFEFCFVYLDDAEFSLKVEQVVSLRERFSNIKIIAFPYLRSQTAAMRMLSMGVNGQCSPFIAKEQLKLVLSVVDSGEIWGGKDFIQQLIKQSSAPIESQSDLLMFEHSDLLSDRELSVADLVAKGMSNKEIARRLEVTERTVKAHLTTVYKKLSIKDRLSLALLVNNSRDSVEASVIHH
ncbi:response regulator transcription factor [Marinomonas ostreistagni]|uniref:Response regulator transcription factor n=1 Tax=Marinomonas ostreistagni TaxID=359209 RepID=A0ABS0ZDJ8_9GAMM|nr:response regulator transcription factor [Marinomonas ostreistagni]